MAETEQILKIGEDTKTKGRILKKIHGKCQFLNILVSFNGFRPFLKKWSKKEELWTLRRISDFGKLDLLSLIGLYHNVRGRIVRSGPHKTCRWLKILEFNIRLAQKASPNTLSKSHPNQSYNWNRRLFLQSNKESSFWQGCGLNQNFSISHKNEEDGLILLR